MLLIVPLLERETIWAALSGLDTRLGARGSRAELLLVGAAVMCLVLVPADCMRRA